MQYSAASQLQANADAARWAACSRFLERLSGLPSALHLLVVSCARRLLGVLREPPHVGYLLADGFLLDGA